MAVDFHVANNMEEAINGVTEGDLWFDEEIHEYLWETHHLTQPTSDILINLDPYGDDVFDKDRLPKLIEICELLKQKYDREDVITFADELGKLCQLALDKGKKLFAIGD